MTRIALWIMTNLAIIVLVSVVMSLLGVNTQTMGGLLIFCALFGFGGSFFSLMISKWIAKRSMGCRVIENPADQTERWLVDTIARQAQQAGIAMPEVAIYDAPDMNAFATGPSRNNSMVAVSTGLMYNMSQNEVEAVLGHEVSHIANGDMVTMTLLQGVLNTFVMFAARIIASIISNAMRSSDDDSEGLGMFAHMAVVIVLEIVFGLLASLVISAYSRHREFKADEGGARLSTADNMIAALQRLKVSSESQMPDQMAAFGINGKKSLTELLMSHPPLDKRIEALRQSKM